MNGQEIVDRLEAKLDGQQVLFPDPDYVLRHTPFKATGDDEFDRQVLIYWWMHAHVPNGYGDMETPYEVYKTWSNGQYRYFKYCKADGSYNPETKQNSIQVSLYRDEPLAPQLAEFALWLPHVKPAHNPESDNEVGKRVSVFEHTLGEHGIYTLWIYSDTDIELEKCAYGHVRVLKNFGSLQDAMAYVQNRHYYERKHDANDNDDVEDSDE